jgi:hypothetical protein
LEFGGDDLAEVTYSDGSKSKIEAGRGFLFFGGARLNVSNTTPHAFDAQASVGMKWAGTKQASNGEVDFFRWPIELLSFYRNTEKNFRLGGGFVYQIGNETRGSKAASAASMKLKNTTGVVLQGDYLTAPEGGIAVGIRYTFVRYEARSGGLSVDGDSLGFQITVLWF